MKYLDDFKVGQVYEFRTKPLSKQQIMEFAQEWDPQPLHLDEAHSVKIHGSLIASGLQTILVVFQPLMSEMMGGVANIGGIGFDSLRWVRPMRPDETLDIRVVIVSVTHSRSKPDRGVMKYTIEARNPADEVIFTAEVPVMIQRKKGGTP